MMYATYTQIVKPESSTRESNVIDFGDHFIHLQCQMLRAHAHQAAWERNKQPLNRVELIQILLFYFKTDPELFFKPVAME